MASCKDCIHYEPCWEYGNILDPIHGGVKCDSFKAADDVVPRSEFNELWYKLEGVMHSVDKWLDGDELNKDEVNRAITMREKTLRIVEELRAEVEATTKHSKDTVKSEVAREIFAEVERLFFKNGVFIYIRSYNKLKKKYTEGGE